MQSSDRMDDLTCLSSLDPHALTFHIVYTAGTVELLSPFIESLLQQSPFRYCLVSNGCGREEQDRLAEIAATSPRLDLRSMPTAEVRFHDEILDWLFEQSAEPHFAFMDSDIFAVAPFGQTVTTALEKSPTFFACSQSCFACSQSWVSADERSAPLGGEIAGRHLSAKGQPVGTTFFAVYERRWVEAARVAYGIGFKKCSWERLPAAARERLRAADLHYDRYDTAKALNLLLRLDGASLHYDPLPALVHVGGVSVRTNRAETSSVLAARPRGPRTGWVRAISRARRAVVHRVRKGQVPHAAHAPQPYRARRALTGRYFGAVIPALQAGQTPPPVPDVGEPFAQREIERVARALAAFYALRRQRIA